MNFDFSELVDEFANAYDLEVARELPPTYDGGVPTPGGWVRFTIPAAFIFPMAAAVGVPSTRLQYGPGGARLHGSIKMLLRDGVGLGYETPARGDVFEWQGHTYRVVALTDWRPGGGFLEIQAMRQDVDEAELADWIEAEGGEPPP